MRIRDGENVTTESIVALPTGRSVVGRVLLEPSMRGISQKGKLYVKGYPVRATNYYYYCYTWCLLLLGASFAVVEELVWFSGGFSVRNGKSIERRSVSTKPRDSTMSFPRSAVGQQERSFLSHWDRKIWRVC